MTTHKHDAGCFHTCDSCGFASATVRIYYLTADCEFASTGASTYLCDSCADGGRELLESAVKLTSEDVVTIWNALRVAAMRDRTRAGELSVQGEASLAALFRRNAQEIDAILRNFTSAIGHGSPIPAATITFG